MNIDIRWKRRQMSDGSIPSTPPGCSAGSYSTAATEDWNLTRFPHSEIFYDAKELQEVGDGRPSIDQTAERLNSSTSMATYASTAPSRDNLNGGGWEERDDDVRVEPRPVHPTSAIPSNPRNFAEVFPLSQRMLIGHDDSTSDGNMNLRLDTEVAVGGTKRLLTLFHLRMYDLRARDMSFRRYCRDSGREVCRSRRVFEAQADSRSSLPLRLGDALANLWPKSGSKDSISAAWRTDSTEEPSPAVGQETSSVSSIGSSTKLPATKAIKLEFSNYALVDLKRKGTSAGQGKRYEFQYWGSLYEWRRRLLCNDAGEEEASLHLFRADCDDELACIVPLRLNEAQVRRERRNGGWIPPCTMELLDRDLQHSQDVSDVAVATGLIALVDDVLKRGDESKRPRPILLPLYRGASFRLNMEFVGPKRLLSEALGRSTPEATSLSNPALRRRVSVNV